MSALKAFRKLLAQDPAVTAAVGTRIYPGVSTSATYPQIVLTVVSTVPTQVLHEVSPLDQVRLQVSIYDTVYLNAIETGEMVRAAVDDFSGVVEGVRINRISFETGREVFEPGLEAHHNAIDFTLLIHR